jgi:hypothetical protein
LGSYNGALARLPTDVREYTDCPAIIKRARTRDIRPRYAFVQGVLPVRGRTFQLYMHLPPCRTALRRSLRLEVRRGRRVVSLRAPNQCKAQNYRLRGRLSGIETTLRPRRLGLRFYGRHRAESYLFRLWVGRQRVDRGWMDIRPLRAGGYVRTLDW